MDEVNRRLASVVDAIERGGWSLTLQARLAELEQRKGQAVAAQATALPAATPPVGIHPASTTGVDLAWSFG